MPILPACMSEHYMCLIPMEVRKGIRPHEIGVINSTSCTVGTRNGCQVLWKSAQCS